jgi:uncharacterized membrane protein YhhN
MPSPLRARVTTSLILVGALVSIMAADADVPWRMAHYVAKPLATMAALLLAVTADHPLSRHYRAAIGVGLACSVVGDVLLMLPGDHFAFGLAAFLAAHLCFLIGFLKHSRFLAHPVTLVGYALVAITLLTAIFPSVPPSLRVPVAVYVVIITTMAAQSASWMLESSTASARRAAIGAAWFLASDATLAIDRFRADVPYRELLVLGTYYLAQWCIARSVEVSAHDASHREPT